MTDDILVLASARAAKPRIQPVAFNVVDGFDFSSLEYRALFESAQATGFQHPLWLNLSFSHLAHGTGSVLLGRNATEQLVFALPLLKRNLGPFIWHDAADLNVSDYNAMVVDPTFAADPSASRQIETALKRFALTRIRKVRCGEIGFALDDPSPATSMGFQAHEMSLEGLSEDWQSRVLDPSFARFLAKKRKRLTGKAKGSIVMEALTDAHAIRSAFETMRAFRKDRWAGDLLADDAHFEFYVDIATAGCETGLTRTYQLKANGKPAAVLFGIAHQQRFCFLLLGFDADEFRNASPGLLMLESVIGDCIARGDTVFDLTIGDESYKKDFATRSVPMQAYWFGQAPWRPLAQSAFTSAVSARSAAAQLRETAEKARRRTWQEIAGSHLWMYSDSTLVTCCHLGAVA